MPLWSIYITKFRKLNSLGNPILHLYEWRWNVAWWWSTPPRHISPPTCRLSSQKNPNRPMINLNTGVCPVVNPASKKPQPSKRRKITQNYITHEVELCVNTCWTTPYPVISCWWTKTEMSMSEVCPRQIDGSIKGKLQSQPMRTMTKITKRIMLLFAATYTISMAILKVNQYFSFSICSK